MFKRILMALKFGPASEFALAKGVELSKTHGAELHIFHASLPIPVWRYANRPCKSMLI